MYIHLRKRYLDTFFKEFFRNLFGEGVFRVPILLFFRPATEDKIEGTVTLTVKDDCGRGIFENKSAFLGVLRKDLAYFIYIRTVGDAETQIESARFFRAVVDDRGVCQSAVRKRDMLIFNCS